MSFTLRITLAGPQGSQTHLPALADHAELNGIGYLAAITGETAVAAGKTQTREGARYRRIARRRGKPKAGVALGNTQLKVYHALLSSPGTRYQDLGVDYYDNRASTRRQVRALQKRASELGYTLVPDLTGCPEIA